MKGFTIVVADGAAPPQIRVERVQGTAPVDREALRQQIQRTVEQAVREGQAGAREGAAAAREGAIAAREGAAAAAEAAAAREAGVFAAQVGRGQGTATTESPTRIFINGEPLANQVEGMFYALVFSMAAVLILRPLMSAWGRRLERKAATPALPAETAQQIARIEQAVEAIAIEVERISEGQRFAARVLSERERERLPS